MSNTPPVPIPDKQAALLRAWNALQGSRVIAVHAPVIHVTGSLKAGILLSQLIYWTTRGERIIENDGWIFKKTQDLTEEIGLSKREQDTVKAKLVALDLVEIKRTRTGMNSGLAFKVNLQKLGQELARFLQVDLTDQELNITTLRNKTLNRKLFGRTVAFHRDLVHLTGDINAAVMLSSVFWLTKKNHDNHKPPFITIKIDQWQNMIGLSWYEQYQARRKLLKLGILSEKHLEASRRIYLFLDGHVLLKFYSSTLPNILAKIGKDEHFSKKTLINSQIAGFHTSECGKPQIGENQALTEDKEICHLDCTKLRIRIVQNSELACNKTENTDSTKLENSGTKLGIVYSKDYINPDYKEKDYNNAPEHGNHEETQAEIQSARVVVAQDSLNTSPPDSLDNLIWPKCFNTAERMTGMCLFNGLLHQKTIGSTQTLLDEIAGQNNLRSPLGLLRTLILSHNNGTFIPLLAHKVVNHRLMQAAINKQIEASTVTPETTRDKTGPKNSEVVQKALDNMRNIVKLKRI